MPKLNNNGVALFLVLGTMLIVIVLAGIILSIISSQSRLTHHQVSRIQAYYAAQSGMVYAFDQLRRGTPGWSATVASTHNLPTDSALPKSIVQPITIEIIPAGGTGSRCPNPPANSACVKIKTNYTYTQ